MSYVVLRHLHMGAAFFSIFLFVFRGSLALANYEWRRWQILRWLPHVNDTVLLGAAIGLAIWSGQYPLEQSWLTAKVLALVLYVILGKHALRQGLSQRHRVAWLVAALATVIYIVSVAHHHNAWPI